MKFLADLRSEDILWGVALLVTLGGLMLAAVVAWQRRHKSRQSQTDEFVGRRDTDWTA